MEPLGWGIAAACFILAAGPLVARAILWAVGARQIGRAFDKAMRPFPTKDAPL